MPGKRLLLIVATAIALLWPAFINGGPFWFPDTSNYIRAADAATVFVTGSPSEWSDRLTIDGVDPLTNAQIDNDGVIARNQIKPTRTVLTGRSIYYGFLVYLPMRLIGPWGSILFQALITAWLIVYCACIALRGRRPPEPALVIAGIATLVLITPLPYYTSMLMPDVFSGLVILCLATLIMYWERLTWLDRGILFAACAAMSSFHTTHLLLIMAVGGLATLFYLPGRKAWRPIAIAVPVFAIGVAAEMLFNVSVSHALHVKPISPPFLSARLTAAGPGTDYLKRHCPQDPQAWALCRFLAVLPAESDSFLWDENPKTGIFQIADSAEQRRLSREDKRFAAAVLADDPLGVIGNSIDSTIRQILAFDLKNFNYPAWRVAGISERYPPAIGHNIAASRAARNTMPVTFNVAATIGSTILALAILIWLIWESRVDRRVVEKEQIRLALLLLLGVFANAAICGGLSGPHARYQMRLIWLLPYVAMILACLRAQVANRLATPARA